MKIVKQKELLAPLGVAEVFQILEQVAAGLRSQAAEIGAGGDDLRRK